LPLRPPGGGLTLALQINGAQALGRLLLAAQVREVFGIVGGKLGPLLHAVAQQVQLRFVEVRQRGRGAMMAAATHAAPGRIAVALGEMGPGGLNMASGLGVALNNNLPLQCTSVCLAFETRTSESAVARLRLQSKSL